MEIYGNFNRKRKGKKLIIAVICAAVILLAVIYYIGLTVGSDSYETQQISSAIAENTRLKEQLSELNELVERQKQEIDSLNEQLSSRPTLAPLPTESLLPIETPMPTQEAFSPRGGLR